MNCEKCGKDNWNKAGKGWSGQNRVMRIRCNACGAVLQRKNISIDDRGKVTQKKEVS